MRRALLLIAVLAIAQPNVSQRARDLHRDALVFDAHVHMVNRQFYQGGSIGQRYANGHVDLPRMKEGGLDALFFSIFVSEEYYPGRHETRHAFRLMDAALRQIEQNRDSIEIALKAADIERINRQGKIAALLDLLCPPQTWRTHRTRPRRHPGSQPPGHDHQRRSRFHRNHRAGD